MEDHAAPVRAYVEKVKAEVAAIERLLEDPQPGLVMWCAAVGQGSVNIRKLVIE